MRLQTKLLTSWQTQVTETVPHWVFVCLFTDPLRTVMWNVLFTKTLSCRRESTFHLISSITLWIYSRLCETTPFSGRWLSSHATNNGPRYFHQICCGVTTCDCNQAWQVSLYSVYRLQFCEGQSLPLPPSLRHYRWHHAMPSVAVGSVPAVATIQSVMCTTYKYIAIISWLLLCSMLLLLLSASLYFSKRDAYWDRLCRDVVGWLSRACTVAKRCILGL